MFDSLEMLVALARSLSGFVAKVQFQPGCLWCGPPQTHASPDLEPTGDRDSEPHAGRFDRTALRLSEKINVVCRTLSGDRALVRDIVLST